MKVKQTVEDYIEFLQQKGFHFGEEELGFISFGQMYSGTMDEQVIAAIEITLKGQRYFDGSYFIALLEQLKEHNIIHKNDAFQYAIQRGIFVE
ncbi:DUF6123 family protein [Bacillus salitolerans]|uniref:DUF6123 family protein n=1 Tax=Bacillus salitolerans TaxID=1437434 RepID=A0ABW4LVL0_9BACI